jgi:hypothetical protein
VEKTRRYSLAHLKAAKFISGVFIDTIKDAAIELFFVTQVKSALIAFPPIASGRPQYRAHEADHPSLGVLFVAQVVLFVASHRSVAPRTNSARINQTCYSDFRYSTRLWTFLSFTPAPKKLFYCQTISSSVVNLV